MGILLKCVERWRELP